MQVDAKHSGTEETHHQALSVLRAFTTFHPAIQVLFFPFPLLLSCPSVEGLSLQPTPSSL